MTEKIINLIKEIRPYEEITETGDLSGILDSLAVFNLITAIEEEFDIIIDDEKIIPENFSSVVKITQIIG
jgi:acyl carrier protein